MDAQTPVAQLRSGDRFDGCLLIRQISERLDKNSRRYLDLNLGDRTGEINCKLWNVPVNMKLPPLASVAHAVGEVTEFNGRIQMKLERLDPPGSKDSYDLSLLIPHAPEPSEAMLSELTEIAGSLRSEKLRLLVTELLRMAGNDLLHFPAAQRMHHAEYGGLLYHTVTMLRMAERMLEVYPFLNADLLRAGVIIHDLCKIDEMLSDGLGNVSDYSRDGLLIGHLVRGVARVGEAAAHTGVTGEWVELLQHMMLSHHGIPEFGSPRYPMFPEAEALHLLDTLDAKMNEMEAIQQRTPEGAFSERIAFLDDRRMYHPKYSDSAE